MGDKMDGQNRWPYVQLSKNDIEQTALKTQMKECCVAFIDILGFKNMVSTDIDSVVLALRYIEMFCKSFFKFPSRETGKSTYPLKYRPEYNYDYSYNQEESSEEEMNKPTVTMFSDSIVISQPFDSFFDISEFVEFISKIQYTLLTEGILIRGGISTGTLYHSDKYLFGTAIVSAYKLESKKAIYPRIIIDEKLLLEIDRIIENKFEQSYKNYFVFNGEKHYWIPHDDYSTYEYSRYIQTDFDGIYYINYLQDNLNTIQGSSKEFLDVSLRLLQDVYEGECKKIIQLINSGLQCNDQKVRKKYEWLKEKYNKTIKHYLSTYSNLLDPDKRKEFFDDWRRLYAQ